MSPALGVMLKSGPPKPIAVAIKITGDCIDCNACPPECPNTAIYETGVEWSLSDGTSLKGSVALMDGTVVEATALQSPLSTTVCYIVPDKCTECQGFHEEPQCVSVCPVDACVPDEMYRETVEQLMSKKEKLHI